MTAWLCRQFGVEKQRDWPAAPFTLLARGGEPGSGYWLQAEPVHLQLLGNRIVLRNSLDLADGEAANLTDALNLHFAQEGLTFLPTRPGHWHVRLPEPPRLETHPLEAAIGRDIRYFLPHGPDSTRWHRLLNEIQMLLHEHPVNKDREQRGDWPVNSIWPWGGGTLPQRATAAYGRIWAHDDLTTGLAIAAGIARAALPESAASWLRQATPGTHLIVLDALCAATSSGDAAGRHAGLPQLEKDWFAPLRQALAQGKLRRLTLHIPGDTETRTFTVGRSDLWKFWRARKPYQTFVGDAKS